jgi:hypothetical protein
VADEDVVNVKLRQDIVKRDDDAARIAEDRVDTLALQRVAEHARPDHRPIRRMLRFACSEGRRCRLVQLPCRDH